MNPKQAYWFARGYYDARNHGYEDSREEVDTLDDHEQRAAYKQGYDTGISDFCDLDMENET